MTLNELGAAAKAASRVLAIAGTAQKDRALAAIAAKLNENKALWLAANEEDLAAARASGMRSSLLDRLTLTEKRIAGVTAGVLQVAALPDPIGSVDRPHHRAQARAPGRDRHHL